MNNRLYRNDNELDNEENQMHHYMHVCTPMNQIHHMQHCDHDNHHHEHEEHHKHEEHHHCHHPNDHYTDQTMFGGETESMPMNGMDDNKHVPNGYHMHHENEAIMPMEDNKHIPNGLHMHHENMAVMPMANNVPMHNNMPMCGMPIMPMMIELEDDDEDECDHKNSEVLKKIEKRNPEILKLMAMYGIPYPAAKKLLKRIIKAVMHHK
jgi:hypothetical protein